MRIYLIIFLFAVLGAACSSYGSISAGDESSGQETGLEANFPEEHPDGIREATASHTAEEAIVKFDSTITRLDDISRAIADAGYNYGGVKPAAN